MQFGVVTLFPEFIYEWAKWGIVGRAFRENLASLECWNPKDFAPLPHKNVDDRPFGGGPGMVLKAPVLHDTLRQAKAELNNPLVVYLTPDGAAFNQAMAQKFSEQKSLLLVSGRYEGIDERFIEQEIDLTCSIGDFVLSGGEIPAMLVMDAIVRLLPDVLGCSESKEEDSFVHGMLDCPHYTRPREWQSSGVPEVLFSGDHQKIKAWRLQQSLGRTFINRPDLFEKLELSKKHIELLNLYLKEHT